MYKIIFVYQTIKTVIDSNPNTKLKKSVELLLKKINKDITNLHFLYNGEKINENLTFDQLANNLDKERKEMNILIEEISSTYVKEKEMKSKEVICPKCNENILLNLKEYKINLYDCKNKHNINNILFEEFEGTQKINLSKIECNICKNNNKSNTFNKKFFKCLNCNINICPLCKSTHNEIHHIINYDFKSIICSKHKDNYLEYCHNCKKDL